MYTFLTNLNNTPVNTTSIFDVVFQLISITFVLFITIGVIYGFAYIAKKLSIGNSSIKSNNINVIEYRGIGNNNNLVITKVGKKYLLLNVSKESSKLICELDEEDLFLDAEQNQASFKDIFNSKFKNTKDKDGGK